MLSQAISLLKLKVEFRETKDKVENVGPRFFCKSCDSPIFMDFQRLVYIILDSSLPHTDVTSLGRALTSA